MDHRFSQLFFHPPAAPSSLDDITMTGALPDPQTPGKRKSTAMKQLIRKLLGMTRQTADPLVKPADPVHLNLSQQVWIEFVQMPNTASKTTKSPSTLKNIQSTKSRRRSKPSTSDSAVVVYPPSPPLPSFGRKEVFHKSSPNTSSASSSVFTSSKSNSSGARDSKFSSISSLPSLATLSLLPSQPHTRTSSPGPSLTLSISELALLQSLIRKLARQLKKQEYLTNHLAGNLVYVFGKKEAQIHGMKRIRVQDREIAAREVWRLRESVGRSFLRRGVLAGRSEGALNHLRTSLDTAARAPSTPQNTTQQSSSAAGSQISNPPTLSPSDSPNSSPRSSTSVSQTNEYKFMLPSNILTEATQTLHVDLSLYSILNSELKNKIYTACLESRWNGLPGGGMTGNVKGNTSDRIMMHRFVSFVENRIELIEACDSRLGLLVGQIEGFGKGRS